MYDDDEKIRALSKAESDKLLGEEKFRSRVNEIIQEYTNRVDFMRKVCEYAGTEIDRRQLNNVKYWSITIGTAIITSLVTALIALFSTAK